MYNPALIPADVVWTIFGLRPVTWLILIAVVIGALLLAGLYALFNSTIMPTVTQKVTGLFNYSGK